MSAFSSSALSTRCSNDNSVISSSRSSSVSNPIPCSLPASRLAICILTSLSITSPLLQPVSVPPCPGSMTINVFSCSAPSRSSTSLGTIGTGPSISCGQFSPPISSVSSVPNVSGNSPAFTRWIPPSPRRIVQTTVAAMVMRFRIHRLFPVRRFPGRAFSIRLYPVWFLPPRFPCPRTPVVYLSPRFSVWSLLTRFSASFLPARFPSPRAPVVYLSPQFSVWSLLTRFSASFLPARFPSSRAPVVYLSARFSVWFLPARFFSTQRLCISNSIS